MRIKHSGMLQIQGDDANSYPQICRTPISIFPLDNRRSQKRSMTWARYWTVMPAWMPRMRIVHNLYPKAV
jgi:hypothetical protein